MKPSKKYSLYERSVQNPEGDVEFVNEKFKEIRGKAPLSLREDFGGTGFLCCEWVKQSQDHRSFVIDLDPEPMEYGKKNRWKKLSQQDQERVSYSQMNVLNATEVSSDVVVAFNFSYFIFKKRKELLDYFSSVRKSLKPGGIFFTDCFGGTECYYPIEEETKHSDFKYFWDLDAFNPIDNSVIYHIHFKEKGKPKQKKVFSYDWRMWSLVEIQEILKDAGFRDVVIYWEGDSKDDEGGDGEFYPALEGEQCESWVVYIAAY